MIEIGNNLTLVILSGILAAYLITHMICSRTPKNTTTTRPVDHVEADKERL